RAHPSVPRDLRASAVPHSTGKGHGVRGQTRIDRPGPAGRNRRRPGTAAVMPRPLTPVRATLAALATAGALAAATVSPLAQGGQPTPSPSFRAGVDLVSLNVTVTDGTRYV